MVTVEEVRSVALQLPRSTEAFVHGRVKFRVGRIVYASVSPDEERLGFGFPREERAALVASRPETFMMPLPSDERYQWVNQTQFIGEGRLVAGPTVEYRVYRVEND